MACEVEVKNNCTGPSTQWNCVTALPSTALATVAWVNRPSLCRSFNA